MFRTFPKENRKTWGFLLFGFCFSLEGEKHWCVRDTSIAANQGSDLQPRHVSLIGNRTGDLSVHRTGLNSLSHTSQDVKLKYFYGIFSLSLQLPFTFFFFNFLCWLAWFSGLGIVLQAMSLVRFLVRAHARVSGSVPGWGRERGNWSLFLLHINLSLPLFLLPFPSF